MLSLLLSAFLVQQAVPNEAPDIVAALTQEVVEIREDFAGAELMIFGATRGLTLTDEIVVVLRGPDRDLRVMRKRRNFGIWMNTAPAEFSSVPAYYAIASSRPIGDFTTVSEMEREGIGLDQRLRAAQAIAPVEGRDPLADYRMAVTELAQRDGLFAEMPMGVEILDGGLFRARIALPPRTPVGDYTAEFYLFRNDRAVASRVSTLRVEKAGLERIIFDFAHRAPIIYGLFAVALAMLAGWAANAIFARR